MKELPFAETVSYWKSGSSSPDVWIQKAVDLLKKLGATSISEGFGSVDGRAAFAIAFEFDGEKFRSAWPVLPTKRPDDFRAARIQAATFVYHDLKAKALSASVLGVRSAFVGNLLLKDGRTTAEASSAELLAAVATPLRLGHKS